MKIELDKSTISLLMSAVALMVSIFALILNYKGHVADYGESILVEIASDWPMKKLKAGASSEVILEITNTSKTGIDYNIQVASNAFCARYSESPAIPHRCNLKDSEFEKEVFTLGRAGSGASKNDHRFLLEAMPGLVSRTENAIENGDGNAILALSNPEYFFTIQIISYDRNDVLFTVTCYYEYESSGRIFSLYNSIAGAGQNEGCYQQL